MRTRLFVLLGAAALVAAAGFALAQEGTDDELWKLATLYFKPLPDAAPNPDNPVTAAKVELGKLLYFDARLSKEGNISCNSCHDLATFGVDNLPTSPGDAGELGARNSPTVLNAALHGSQFWDGRAGDVEAQAGMPILNPVEMAIPSEQFLVDRLSQYPDYQERFAAAFPGDDPPLTYLNVSRALAAFERTLLTPSRFDDYLRGDRDALSAEEKHGLETFLDMGCASCHNGVNVGAHIFRKFGLNESYWQHTKSARIDEGRFTVTGEKDDKYVFKVQSLRNVAETYPYFHDGSVATLEEAVQVMSRLQVGMELEESDVRSVAAFLKTLSGKVPEAARAAPQAGGK
jgi:cytochrome c peroxidase